MPQFDLQTGTIFNLTMELCRETYLLQEFNKIADTHTDAFDADEEIQPVETDDKGYVNEVLFKLTKSPKD